jgi:DNA-binding CsgD family transcriptional regulator
MGIDRSKVKMLRHLKTVCGTGNDDSAADLDIMNISSGKDMEEEVINKVMREDLIVQMNKLLNKQECQVLQERLGLNEENSAKTLFEVAIQMGMSRERVRQLQKNAADKLVRHNKSLDKKMEIYKGKKFPVDRITKLKQLSRKIFMPPPDTAKLKKIKRLKKIDRGMFPVRKDNTDEQSMKK